MLTNALARPSATLFNNNWVFLYETLTILDDIMAKTDPATGTEDNFMPVV